MVKPSSQLCSFLIMVTLFYTIKVDSKKCHGECTALASYYLWGGANLTLLTEAFNTNYSNIMGYNPQIYNFNKIYKGQRVNVPFQCGCLRGSDSEFLGHQFRFKSKTGNAYERVADIVYSRLTRVEWLVEFNGFDADQWVEKNQSLNVPVLCSCGNKKVSKDYGLFITYPLRPGENLSSVAQGVELSEKLLMDYNPGVDFSSGEGMVFIPGKDQTRTYPPLKTRSSGLRGEVIAGLSVAGATVTLALAACFYFGVYRRKNSNESSFSPTSYDGHPIENKIGSGIDLQKNLGSRPYGGDVSPKLTGITVDKSLEFTYNELAEATSNFSLANKIGQGGFGSVYYAELRGEKVAIKKMDMQASKVFLAELKVLTNVHHVNLVRLIGYSVETSLIIVYEFIENGNLCQHLRGFSEKEPLSWSTRLQIALDSARGLEYIHEHTNPAYIHRDIKSPNILLDKNLHAKVADFGLTKLVEVGTGSLQTQLVGTFGYMPPEYAQYGEVSTKIDVYAFGVVFYELISAREAIGKSGEVSTGTLGIVAMFEEVMNQPDPSTDLRKLVDPRLGEDYPIDSVCKIAQLAKACTQQNHVLRPSMRSVVVALMSLISGTGNWHVSSSDKDRDLVNLMSGR
ncbi:chitin elicitor receptor kinase 1-like [Daucus carota subsp. sativus]|uniref:chitin elicitor receptor kinase 1-like n=1 Tax=Daucus carota subsp. sativus TaxID=79200 RepID=UPI0007EF7783|nr:PREDICTED: chitin elicitor receptor kinase 1-like [Daucus carota subsp. sativus]